MTSAGLDWDREKWRGSVASKFIRGGEKSAVKYADEIIVLSKDVQKYFLETYGRETHFIPNGVNRPEVREAKLITDHFGLEKDSYILFLGRLVPEKGIRYLVEAFKNVKTDKKLVIAGGSSDTDQQSEQLCVQRHQSHWRNPAGLRHRANRPCPQRPRCQPAGARLYDVFWRRCYLLCKGYFGHDSIKTPLECVVIL